MGTVGCACNHVQPLRSCPQPLQRCESHGVASETEAPLELVDTEGAILSFPLQHTTRRQATAEMLPLRPGRADLTATQPELLLTHRSVARLYCPLVTGNTAQASPGMLTNRRQ